MSTVTVEILTTSDIARLAGVTPRGARKLFATGKLPTPLRTVRGIPIWDRRQIQPFLDTYTPRPSTR